MPAELDAFLREHPLTGSVDILLPDLAGVLRGKRLPPADVRKALAGEAFFTTTVYAIDTPDAPLIAPGEPALLNFTNRFASLRGGVHVNLYNNVWGTNFPMWYEDDARFRFTLSFG